MYELYVLGCDWSRIFIQGVSTGSILLNNPSGSSNVFYNNILQVCNSTTTNYIKASGDIIPSGDNLYSLGSSRPRGILNGHAIMTYERCKRWCDFFEPKT